MYDHLRLLETSAIWALFFLSNVYGHVALKLAVRSAPTGSYLEILAATATNLWGWSAVSAWCLSCALWVLVLSRHKLMVANGIAALGDVLICLAAWGCLNERVTSSQGLGIGLILVGVLLLK